ncbi:hypothetical protein K456DRAFT_1742471 [Colletotrichum gloeosporioides 23]|nr:hypothetical protein K456DRAFT_1742471 [Colletotrichum gloeosporioides 23]
MTPSTLHLLRQCFVFASVKPHTPYREREIDIEPQRRSLASTTVIMKATFAYVIVAALFGVSRASVTPLNNIIRHEYNLNARAGVHGNLAAIARRDEAAAHTPESDVLQPVV